jgi:hypothetical protein
MLASADSSHFSTAQTRKRQEEARANAGQYCCGENLLSNRLVIEFSSAIHESFTCRE